MSETIKLVHGTTASHLDAIRQHGLRPRGPRQASTWDQCPSDPYSVYLTNAYSLYFAQNALQDREDALLVEVAVPLSRLQPDEDYLGQACGEPSVLAAYLDLIPRTLFLRDRVKRMKPVQQLALAEASLDRLGTVRHQGAIPARAITRWAVVPYQTVVETVMRGYDPTITLRNYRLLGEKYRTWQAELLDQFAEGNVS